jgi:hypothetical protein
LHDPPLIIDPQLHDPPLCRLKGFKKLNPDAGGPVLGYKGSTPFTLLEVVAKLEEQLPPRCFLRVQRDFFEQPFIL